MFRVHHNYMPDKEVEHTDIDVHIGDVITNLEYLDNGWAIGYNVNTRKAGIFPRRNVKPIQEDNSSIFPPRQPKYRPVFSEDRVEEYVHSDEIVDWLSNLNVEAFKKAYYQVVHTHRNQYRILKAIVGLVWGIIFGVLTFLGLSYALEYPLTVAAAIACAVGFILIIGLAFSTKCRAIVALCLPTLTTKSGRLMLSAIALAILIGGPVTNITNNASEMATVSSCAADLLANQTELIRQLAQEPYDEFVAGLKKTIGDLRDTISTITNILKPIQDVVGEFKRVSEVVSNELRRAQSQCLSGLDSGASDCRTKMLEASTRCNNFVSDVRDSFNCGGGIGGGGINCGDNNGNAGAAIALCNSINNQLCSPVEDVKTLCNGLSVNLTDLTGVLAKLEQALSTEISLKDTIEGQVTTNGTLVDFGESIKKELKERTSLITQIFTYANWVLSLTVILLVIQSYIYLRKYLRDDRHDNNYITRTFETVDEKRMEKGKWSLLPLTPKEQKLVTDKGTWNMSTFERKTFCAGFLPVLLNIIGGVVVVGFDFLLYEAILLSNKYETPKIEIKENIDLGVEVEDGGLLSTFLQDIMGNMRIQSKLDHTIDFNQCQPNGEEPGYVPIIGLGILYLCMVLTVTLNAYALRLRHFLAGYFYEEREKDRVKFLHRKLLRRRVITLKELKDVLMVKRADLENKEVVKDFWDDLKAGCICIDQFREECYLCETKDITDNLNWCEHCNSYFCTTCFNFTLNKVCPCNPDVSLSYDHVTDSDFEDDVQDRIVEQYYSYADRGQGFDFSSSAEDMMMEDTGMTEGDNTLMRNINGRLAQQQSHDRREISNLRKNRNSNFLN